MLETFATLDPGPCCRGTARRCRPPPSPPAARLDGDLGPRTGTSRDALGVTRTPTARLRHVATLGVRAMPYGFAVRGLPAPRATPCGWS
ncbi:hypothetical protein [Nonomuraea dietziae]|uniref:hypothetical protein n=1 Tax=Nonomuraea dietziae TaxID=65515 RepID=UPI0031D5D513